MAKKQKSPAEEEPTPLLDLAAARLVKTGVAVVGRYSLLKWQAIIWLYKW